MMGREVSRSSMILCQMMQAIVIMSLNEYSQCYSQMDITSLRTNRRWLMNMNAFMIACGIKERCNTCPLIRHPKNKHVCCMLFKNSLVPRSILVKEEVPWTFWNENDTIVTCLQLCTSYLLPSNLIFVVHWAFNHWCDPDGTLLTYVWSLEPA